MSGLFQTVLSVVGAIGGLVGVWAAIATVRRDRARITLQIGFCRATKPIPEYIQVILPSEALSSYYLTVTIRNIGYRPVFLEKIEFEYQHASEADARYQISSACDLVLEETRRSHTVYIDLTHAPEERPLEVAVTDHRGVKHRVKLTALPIVIWLHQIASRPRGRYISSRLAAAHSLNEFFADDDRDPFRVEGKGATPSISA